MSHHSGEDASSTASRPRTSSFSSGSSGSSQPPSNRSSLASNIAPLSSSHSPPPFNPRTSSSSLPPPNPPQSNLPSSPPSNPAPSSNRPLNPSSSTSTDDSDDHTPQFSINEDARISRFINLHIYEAGADGDCGPRALAVALQHLNKDNPNQYHHFQVRERVAGTLSQVIKLILHI